MTLRILLVLPPWVTSEAERTALVDAAARLGPAEVLAITQAADAAAVSEFLAVRLADVAAPVLALLPAGAEGEQVAAALATAVGGCALGRCTALAVAGDAVLARRAVFGGRAELAVRSTARVTCAALRPEAVPEGSPAAPVRQETASVEAPPAFAAEPLPSAHSHPRVEGATMVVSGGRGIGGPEGFELLARVAGALGAGLGGSLPAVDAGWVPVAHQVGQSGKFVAPKVYFAVGISGTPQHLAGIAPSVRIVALNNDRDAPIFGRSDVAVEGDWREILPLLVQQLEG